MGIRIGSALLVLGLVVLAGCSVLPAGSGDGPVDTVTPVPVTEQTPDERVSPESLPPGVSAGGDLNVPALERAHGRALGNQSYEWTVRYVVSGEESPLPSRNYTRRVVVDEDALLAEQKTTNPPVDDTLYVSDGTGYLRSAGPNETAFERIDQARDSGEFVFADEILRRFLDGVEPEISVVEHNERTYYRLHSADGELPDQLRGLGSGVWNYEVTAYVTPEGLVGTLVVDYDRGEARGVEHVSIRYDYTDLGTATVTEPDWLSAVPAETPTPTPTATDSVTPTTTESPTTARPPTGTANTSTDSPGDPETATPILRPVSTGRDSYGRPTGETESLLPGVTQASPVYAVELHAHSAASYDGRDPVERLLNRASDLGLDALAVTDHDEIEASRRAAEVAPEYGLVGIVGLEVSTAAGHVLALGIEDPVEPGLGFAETLARIREQGGIAVVPHPFQEMRNGVMAAISRDQLAEADAVEVYNSRLVTGWSNCQAKQFARRRDLPMTAGSDAHVAEMVGRAVTLVDAEERSGASICAAIRAGRTTLRTRRTPFHVSLRQAVGNTRRRVRLYLSGLLE